MCNGLFTERPGYVWSIQPSWVGGYDLHLTLLFDTNALRKVLEDKKIENDRTGAVAEGHADEVGASWVMATKGQGGYVRIDRNDQPYGRDWVHGEVRADDVARRERLMETLSYLAMRRTLIRLKNEPPGVYFGLPRPRSPSWIMKIRVHCCPVPS